MKSAAKYPEYRGDPDNIQFLTYNEHLEAHKGSWQNPTNWYYNPITKEYIDFGDNAPTPCNIIELSDPFVRVPEPIQRPSETAESSQNEGIVNNLGNEQAKGTTLIKPSTDMSFGTKTPPKSSKSFGERIMYVVEVVKGFSERHPILTGVFKFVGVAGVAAGASVIANSGKGSGSSSDGSGLSSANDYFSSSSDDDHSDFLYKDNYDDSFDGIDYPEERSSPKEHMVPGHGQHYHTKDGVIWKEKDSYLRGGKHDDE